MVERLLVAFLARARGSKGGAWLIFVGVVILLAFLVFGLVSVVGNAVLLWTGAGPVMQFLGTGPGVLTGFLGAVFLILLGVAFLNRATPQVTASTTAIQESGSTQAERELDRLQKRLRRTEQERDELRALLADPTAKRRREEEVLQKKCGDVAFSVRNFARAGRSTYANESETVERFRLRHYASVEEVRNELDRRGKLTAEERDALTLRANDGIRKIGEMAEVLGFIAAG